MDNARVAAVSYLNTIPLIAGLDRVEGLELIRAVPSRIAAMIEDGSADLGLASLIDAARASVPMALHPVGMIGCEGPTLTVRLFSAVEPEQITVLHADTDSHTSVTLARIILAERYGVRPQIRDFDTREQMPSGEGIHEPDTGGGPDSGGWPETVLLIGDKVVVGSPPAVRYPHQIDLGQAWHELTGLPFVYAVWMSLADRADEPQIRTAAGLLDRQRRRNLMRLDRLVTDSAETKGWPEDLARDYLGRLLRYEVGPREREAAALFVSKAAELGVAPKTELIWADEVRASEVGAGV
ncbi:MAG: putative solute-binding protein [Phycisphaerales bacterium]|jgi:predicted solute-binding protein